jgi:hypothetical protein
MIAGLSKVITLYLAPLLALTSIVLILLTFISPIITFHDQVALLVVSPSSSLTNPGAANSAVDGPTVFFGALGTFYF